MKIVGAFYFLELTNKMGPSVIKRMAVCANFFTVVHCEMTCTILKEFEGMLFCVVH